MSIQQKSCINSQNLVIFSHKILFLVTPKQTTDLFIFTLFFELRLRRLFQQEKGKRLNFKIKSDRGT